MTNSGFQKVEQAIKDFQAGKIIIIMDDYHRENEGDFVIAADKITPDVINFMAQSGRGLICMPMAAEIADRLGLPMMVARNASKQGTPFTVSIGASTGITTGISAHDRARTVEVAVNPNSGPADISSPGHIFPLRAAVGGVFSRGGHTEASVDLAKLAGLSPATVVCEIMNPDGTMARQPDLEIIAKEHDLTIITVAEILDYRLMHEEILIKTTAAKLPLKNYGNFKVEAYVHRYNQSEHIVLINDQYLMTGETPLVRIHSQCITGDVFGSNRCDCRSQLEYSMEKITQKGGILIYLDQEGRGIGLANKIKAYALQDQGMDTVEANHSLGFQTDQREYSIAMQILKSMHLQKIRLLTNNPQKIAELEKFAISVERVAIEHQLTSDNLRYLQTKQQKMGHLLDLVDK